MPTWPDSLPQCPLLDSFNEQRQRNVATFQPDVGPPKMRRRSTASCVNTSVAFNMTTSQVADFDEFYEDTLADGSLPFDWDHPISKVPYSWIFSPEQAPQKQRTAPGQMRVSFVLMRLP